MIKKSDIKEISKTLEIKECSIQNMVGAYVDKDKSIVCKIDQKFLTLPEELLFKYLAIAKKLYSKKVGDNVISSSFSEHIYGEETKRLLELVLESKLKDEVALDALYDRIIDEYDCVGNFLILLWYDVYDIPGRGTDGADQGESEEVYERIMCAICRVDLTAAGLSYKPNTNEFAVRERDWVVDYPACGFVYPSFEDRTVERESIMFYCEKAANPPHGFMERGLGMQPCRTITEIRKDFGHVLTKALDGTSEAEYWMPHIAKQMYMAHPDDEDVILLPKELEKFCGQTGMGEVKAQNIRNRYISEFNPKYPKVSYFLNRSAIKAVEELMKKQERQIIFRKAAVALEKAEGESDLIEQLYSLAESK